MQHGASRWFALISILTLTALFGRAGTRASYGGDLRVAVSAQLTRLDPAFTPESGPDAALRLRLLPLVFEGLVKLNDRGIPEPVLASAWTSSTDFRRWSFSVRPGARFHDGLPVTAPVLVECLTTVENPFIVHEYEGRVVFEAADPMPGLLHDLAMPEKGVSRTIASGATVGTGPFRIESWEPGRGGVFAAFEGHWGGRPFIDRIVLEMGQAPRNQWMNLELGRTDLIEVPVEEVRDALQRGYRLLTSRPLELMALFFSARASSPEDIDLRRALALAVDREAILRVLLQRQGEATGSLLPQWLSGHAFLFHRTRDLARARSLLPPLGPDRDLRIGYPSSDRIARSICERLALDVQAAGLKLNPVPVQDDTQDTSTLSATLVRISISSLDENRALKSLASRFGLEAPHEADWRQPETVFKAELELLKNRQVIPLFHLPSCYAVGPRVRYQRPEDVFLTHALHLENVWLERTVVERGSLSWPDSPESGSPAGLLAGLKKRARRRTLESPATIKDCSGAP